LLDLERVCNDFGQFRLDEFSVRRYLVEFIKKAIIKAVIIRNDIIFIRNEAELQNKSLLKKQDSMIDVLDRE